MKRILVITDHSYVVQAVRTAVQRIAGLVLVGASARCVRVAPALMRLRPDIVVIDDSGARELTLERVTEVVTGAPDAKCVLLTPAMDEPALKPAFGAGVDAAIKRTGDPAALGGLLRAVAEDRIIHPPQWSRARGTLPPDCRLTSRELEILRLAAHGHTNDWIARELSLTPQTIKFHLSNVYRKLGVVNRTEAARYAHVHRLVEAPADLLVS